MAEKLGIGFVVGATVGASVASAFASVESKIKATQRAFGNAAKAARSMDAVLKAREARDAAKARVQATGGQNAKALADLKRLNREYVKARQSALAYGRSVEDWRRKHQQAAAAVETTAAKLARLKSLQDRKKAMQDESSRRKKIVGDAMGLTMSGLAMAAPLRIGIGFEEGMSKVKAISGATGQDFEALKAQARELGATTVWSATEAAEGMSFLAMAGFNSSQTMAAMPGMLSLASAGAVDLGTTADIASNVLTGFGFKAEKMNYVGDVLAKTFTRSNTTLQSLGESMKFVAPTAAKAGQSFQDTAAMIGKLGDAGIQGSMAGTGLNAIIGRMAKPPEQAAQALRRLRISIMDANGNMRAMPDIFAEIARKTSRMSEVQRLAYAKMLFGTEHFSKGLVLMSAAANGSLQELSSSLYEEGYATRVAKEQTDNLAGDLKALNSASEEVAISIYDAVSPVMRTMTQDMTGAVQKAGLWVKANPELARGLFMVGGALVGLKAGALAFSLLHSVARSSMLSVGGAFASLRQGMAMTGAGARRMGSLFRISWGQALAPVSARISGLRQRMASLRGGMASLRAAATSTAASLRTVGMAGFLAGSKAMVAGGMARASRMGWSVLRAGVMGVGSAFKIAFGPISLLMTALSFGVEYLIEHWDTIAPYFTKLWDGVKAVFNKALEWMSPIFDTVGAAFDKLGEAWNWMFGDDEKKAAVEPNKANPPSSAAAPSAAKAEVKPAAAQAAVVPAKPAEAKPKPNFAARVAQRAGTAQPDQKGEGAAPVSVSLQFSLNGMPDTAFAQGVICALREHSGELENLISGIVHNQARLAYGA